MYGLFVSTNLLVVCATLALGHDSNFVFPCTNPNGEEGFCMSLFKCSILLKSLGSLDGEAIAFVKQSICHDHVPNDFFVCCGPSGTYEIPCVQQTSEASLNVTSFVTERIPDVTSSSERSPEANQNIVPDVPTIPTPPPIKDKNDTQTAIEEHRKYVKEKLLPRQSFCGLQHTDDRFYDLNSTALDEFPWLVHVNFLDEDDEEDAYLDRCNGVIISNRYILTIAYCATYAPTVRIGQYETNRTISCVPNVSNDGDVDEECSEPKVDIEVEEEIQRSNDTSTWHNFALLRLKKKIAFSDFVRPICLNLNGINDNLTSLYFSGWGAETVGSVSKKRLQYDISQTVDECYAVDDKDLNRTVVEHLCLRPKSGNVTEFACTGDLGGPLMFQHHLKWYVHSMISGIYDVPTEKLCSMNRPFSAIKINEEILNWIFDNMRE